MILFFVINLFLFHINHLDRCTQMQLIQSRVQCQVPQAWSNRNSVVKVTPPLPPIARFTFDYDTNLSGILNTFALDFDRMTNMAAII